MHYNFYLFVNLRIAILPNETEYDIQYGNDIALYEIYNTSNFNDGELPEYECIVNFLQDLKTKIKFCI
jgi:hypothetical protein